MGNAVGSGNNEKNKRKLSETRDDDQEEHDPLWDLPDAVQDIVLGEVELSTEQLKAAGHYLWEVQNAGRDYTSIAVLALPGVVAIQPPSTLDYDESQLDVIHAACFQEWGGCPPDHATIRAMGAVGRRALVRFWSREWKYAGEGGNNGAARSVEAFETFKAMARELNGGEEPGEAFWIKHFKVRKRAFSQYQKDLANWYDQLNRKVVNGKALWAQTNKKWLEGVGVFSAWEKHRASEDFVGPGGYSGEVRGGSHEITTALNQRLQCKEFVYPDDDKRYRVLVVRYSKEFNPPQNIVLCYDARLADPDANQTSKRYTGRMTEHCFAATVEEVEEWIARTPKRARHE